MDLLIPNDQKLWASKFPEATYNTASTTGSDYLVLAAANRSLILPQMEKTDDDGVFKDGHSYRTRRCNLYWTQSGAVLSGEMSFNDIIGRLMLRGLGGAVTSTTLTTPATAHRCNQMPIASGHQLFGTSVVQELGAASYLLPGMVVSRFKLSQSGIEPVQYECELIGTGKPINPHGVTSLPTTYPTWPCADGGNSEVYLTTPTPTTVNYHSNGRLLSWSIEYNNNLKLNDRVIGDPLAGPTGGKARHVTKVLRDKMTVNAQIVVAMDSAAIDEWTQMAKNDALTDVTFRAKSADVITGAIYSSAALICPKMWINGDIAVTNVNNKAAFQVNLAAGYDATIGGIIKAEVVNNDTTVAPNNYR